jgi:DNA polymerase III delta prime subunit
VAAPKAKASPPRDAVWTDLAEALVQAATSGARVDFGALRDRFGRSLETGGVFGAIVASAGLTAAEAEVLGLLCAVEADPALQSAVAALNEDPTATRPTLHLLSRLFPSDHPGLLCVADDSRLRRAALVTVDDADAWASCQVMVAPSVLWSIAGSTALDPDLPVGARVKAAPAFGGNPAGLVVVVGADPTRCLDTAVAETLGDRFLVVPEPDAPRGWEALVREATVSGAGVVLETDELSPLGRWWVERADHLAWCLSCRREPPLATLPDVPVVELHEPEVVATKDEIDGVFPDGDELAFHRLTAEHVRLLSRLDWTGTPAEVGVKRLMAGPLERLTHRVVPVRTWDDLVLSDDLSAQLHEVASRYRNRSKVLEDWGFGRHHAGGIVALFAGPSGTGKTTAAEIIAGDLGLDLFVVNLAGVVSKYIGETEQNLDRVFDAAAAGNLVLLFDEADALFGERTSVSDAHDRYANLEISYLLQRLEDFDGLAILTTNLRSNVDDAFTRRFAAVVDFTAPDAASRHQIWEHWLSSGAPVQEIDLPFLAERFDITGGTIAATALTAAYAASSTDQPIGMEQVILALKRELRKAGRLCTKEQFGPWFHLVDDG